MSAATTAITPRIQHFLSSSRKMLIAGKWVDALSEHTFSTVNPATGEVLCRVPEGHRYGDTGYFVEPTVLVNTTPRMPVVQEEIFGPVLCAEPFRDLEDALEKANASMYGLSAAVWTNDVGRPIALPLGSGPDWPGSTVTTS